MPFVVDASMALAWHFADEATPDTNALLERTIEEPIVVPGHWLTEVANGMLMGERRQRATQEQSAHFLDRLHQMQIEVDTLGSEQVTEIVLPLARAHRLTIYDALYLELAERRGLALATLDGELAAAARSVGVETHARNGGEEA